MDQASNSKPHLAGGQQSSLWEIQVPIAAAAVPATAFWLLGLIASRFAEQGGDLPGWFVVAMGCLGTIGSIAMAIVLLIRYDTAWTLLSDRTDGKPSTWRKAILVLAMLMLLLFDTTVNLAAAFRGGVVLLILGVPAFFAYLALGRLTFVGLRPAAKPTARPHQ